jgi:serine/threonine protein kinase
LLVFSQNIDEDDTLENPTMNPTVALSQPDEPLPQQVGRYRILEQLGAGGMGMVYKAHDPHLDRPVAIKLPHFAGPQPDRLRRVQRFQREARMAARIWHPHVCPIHDIGEHEGQPFVVMPYIEGQSLAQRLTNKGRFDNISEALAIILEVLAALGAVHRGGIIHRDLKDGNILLDADGRAVLTDFGLARPEHDTEHLTSDGIIVGTPSFMAPEMAAGQAEKVGPWTDLYSVGVVLYRMLTGRLPFEGPALTVLSKIANEDPVPPSKWRPDLDSSLEAVVLKALAREPDRRYQNATEFAAALQSWCTTTSLPGTPARQDLRVASALSAAEKEKSLTVAAVSSPARTPKWRKPRWIIPAGCLLTLFFLGGVVVLLILLNAGQPMTTHKSSVAAKGIPVKGEAPVAPALLIEEAAKGHLVRVRQLVLTEHVNPNIKDAQGQTALMKAAANGHIDVVKELLDPGKGLKEIRIAAIVEVNEIDDKSETALMKAAENGHEDVVEALLRHNGIAVNLRDDKGQTALAKAKAKKHPKVIEKLQKAGAKE